MDEQDKRIAQIILGDKFDEDKFNDDEYEDDLCKTPETLAIYFQFLKANINTPCIMTGIEDFPWEEQFCLGAGSKKEHEALKKNNPSSQDMFELIHLEENEDEEQILATVKRQSNKKEFVIGLDWLEAADRKTRSYQVLHDYVVWFVNY